MNNILQESVIDLTVTLPEVNWPSSNTVIVLDDSTSTTTSFNDSNWTSLCSDSIIVVDENLDAAPKKKSARTKGKNKAKQSTLTAEENYRDRSPISFGDCPICLEPLGKSPLASTKCGHVFCSKCIQQTLKTDKKCPSCRQPLRGKTAYHPIYLSKDGNRK